MALIPVSTQSKWGSLIFTSFAYSLVVVIAMYVKGFYDHITVTGESSKELVKKNTNFKGAIVIFLITFIAYIMMFLTMWYVFGWKGY